MSAQDLTGVVEQMLDHAANRRWDALAEVLADDFVIVEAGGRVRRSEVFPGDTAALLDALRRP